MSIDELRTKIEEICNNLSSQALDPVTKNRLENELEDVCIKYYKLRRLLD